MYETIDMHARNRSRLRVVTEMEREWRRLRGPRLQVSVGDGNETHPESGKLNVVVIIAVGVVVTVGIVVAGTSLPSPLPRGVVTLSPSLWLPHHSCLVTIVVVATVASSPLLSPVVVTVAVIIVMITLSKS
ncbi:hypothetical protein EDB89DRAFT_1917282 [Lactarius sanguifluus]|nr:hypothetical protein EDB89DRAFT_1917282 [Lactarius sanguifluus]